MQIQGRSRGFYILVLSLTFGSVILLLLTLLWPKPKVPNNPAIQAQYTARSVGNQVVIYQAGASEPVMLTGIDIRTLPDADRQALEQGIALRDAIDLAHLLEDYDA